MRDREQSDVPAVQYQMLVDAVADVARDYNPADEVHPFLRHLAAVGYLVLPREPAAAGPLYSVSIRKRSSWRHLTQM